MASIWIFLFYQCFCFILFRQNQNHHQNISSMVQRKYQMRNDFYHNWKNWPMKWSKFFFSFIFVNFFFIWSNLKVFIFIIIKYYYSYLHISNKKQNKTKNYFLLFHEICQKNPGHINATHHDEKNVCV